jgi:hypothetical protein
MNTKPQDDVRFAAMLGSPILNAEGPLRIAKEAIYPRSLARSECVRLLLQLLTEGQPELRTHVRRHAPTMSDESLFEWMGIAMQMRGLHS